MALHPTYAFKVIIETGDQRQEHVVAGNDLAAAAVAAQERMPQGGRVVRMVELGELLAVPSIEVSQVASTAAVISAPTTTAPVIHEGASAAVRRQGGARRRRKAPAALQGSADVPSANQPIRRRGTRREQLLALLRQHGAPLHLDIVARALNIKRGHADEVARQAIKAGLVERVGSRTGKIELARTAKPEGVVVETPAAEPPAEVGPPTAPALEAPAVAAEKPRRSGPTRIDRLVELLRGKTEPVHLDEIAAALGMTRGNADGAVRIAARAGLVQRVGNRTGLVELVGAVEPAGDTPAPPAPTSAEHLASAPTRVEQLVALLTERGGQIHITEIAVALDTTRGNVDNVVRAAIKAGLVRRDGSRTGLVELAAPADAAAPVAEDRAPVVEPTEAPAEPAPQGTRVVQLVALLRDRRGPVHVREIREALNIKPANVHNVVAQGVKAGAIRRVGSRTGLVELVEPLSGLERRQDVQADPGVTDGAAEPQWLDPAQLDGIQRRVFDALAELGGSVTAKDVASVLGCRPREAGNALVVLVQGGSVERQTGDGTPQRPASYRLLP